MNATTGHETTVSRGFTNYQQEPPPHYYTKDLDQAHQVVERSRKHHEQHEYRAYEIMHMTILQRQMP